MPLNKENEYKEKQASQYYIEITSNMPHFVLYVTYNFIIGQLKNLELVNRK
jgi:hypothetical protein